MQALLVAFEWSEHSFEWSGFEWFKVPWLVLGLWLSASLGLSLAWLESFEWLSGAFRAV